MTEGDARLRLQVVEQLRRGAGERRIGGAERVAAHQDDDVRGPAAKLLVEEGVRLRGLAVGVLKAPTGERPATPVP